VLRIKFLTLGEVTQIHHDQIERYGGESGIRDIKLLQSAIAQPGIGFSAGYLHADIYEMAAAYLFHIVRNHPFMDGNKRTAVATAIVFLEMNNVEIEAKKLEFKDVVMQVIEGSKDRGAVAEFFKKHSVK
jgi:death-on-curing protein